MKIYTETSLADFEAWSGAIDTLNRIIEEGVADTLETVLDELYPDGLSDTALNDIREKEENRGALLFCALSQAKAAKCTNSF